MNSLGINCIILKNNERKNTYPPLADGLCVPFLCKPRGWCYLGCGPGPPWAFPGDRALHTVQTFAEKCHAVARRLGSRDDNADRGKPRIHWAKKRKMAESVDFNFQAGSF
jgi:hypothetical protein